MGLINKLYQRIIIVFPLFPQIFRFGVIGLSSSFVHFFTVIVLVQNRLFLPLVANIIAFLFAFQVSYWGHRKWTFSETVVPHRFALQRLLLVQLANLLANESLFYLFLAYHIPYPIALLVILTTLPIFTFTASKLWVFR